MGEDTAIKVDQVSKTFKLPHDKATSIKSIVVNFYKRNRTYEKQEALRGISIEIKKGEFFGIVGRNGSGKSTLLKLLAGIYAPTKGEVHVRGMLTPFIELGVGFNMELSGRENVYLNGALLGFSRKEMGAMYDDIVAFAELERFMDQKLKNYSSGMQVRLAFSIAIRAKSDILLIDEVLAVGDMNFQKKCFDYFEELKRKGQTIVLVSHDMDAIVKFCNRAALITKGKISIIGDPEQVAELYEEENKDNTLKLSAQPPDTSIAEITKLTISGAKKNIFTGGDTVNFKFEVRAKTPIRAALGFNILKEDGQLIAGISSHHAIKPKVLKSGEQAKFEYVFSSKQLTIGKFLVDGVVYDVDKDKPIYFKSAVASFEVRDKFRGWGAFNINGQWKSLE